MSTKSNVSVEAIDYEKERTLATELLMEFSQQEKREGVVWDFNFPKEFKYPKLPLSIVYENNKGYRWSSEYYILEMRNLISGVKCGNKEFALRNETHLVICNNVDFTTTDEVKKGKNHEAKAENKLLTFTEENFNYNEMINTIRKKNKKSVDEWSCPKQEDLLCWFQHKEAFNQTICSIGGSKLYDGFYCCADYLDDEGIFIKTCEINRNSIMFFGELPEEIYSKLRLVRELP